MSSEYFYDCLNTHNCGYSFTSSKKERRCTRCDSSFIDLRKVESKCEDRRIFDSIEHLKHEYNLNVEIPKDVPEDCNVVCFRVSFGEGVKFSQACKEDEHGFFRLGWGGEWEKSSESLDDALEFDKHLSHSRYVYLRLATKDNSDVFTPERLLGVETTEGFVTSVFNSEYTGRLFINATNCRNLVVSEVEYYISDDSDETVSFEDYVRMFYEE